MVRRAVNEALQIQMEWVGIVDIGGEPIRPGAKEMVLKEELRRTIPFINGIREGESEAHSRNYLNSSLRWRLRRFARCNSSDFGWCRTLPPPAPLTKMQYHCLKFRAFRFPTHAMPQWPRTGPGGRGRCRERQTHCRPSLFPVVLMHMHMHCGDDGRTRRKDPDGNLVPVEARARRGRRESSLWGGAFLFCWDPEPGGVDKEGHR